VSREGLWSLGTVSCRIANAEDGWFRYIAAGELDEWPLMEAERYATVASVKAPLEEVHEYTLSYLRALDIADLDRTVTTFWGTELTLRWIIWHALEHEISHRGEIYLMLGLMGMEAPDVSASYSAASRSGVWPHFCCNRLSRFSRMRPR
jgi:uncharacterized damage-inducible protein DinB